MPTITNANASLLWQGLTQAETLRCMFSDSLHTCRAHAIYRLNTFLELKMDNEVLQQRAAKLRAQNGMTGSSVAGPSNALHSYNTTPSTSSGGQMSIRTSIPNHMMAATSSAHLDYSMSPLYPSTSSRSDEIAPSPTTRNFDTISGYGDRDEETSAEPMRKKVHNFATPDPTKGSSSTFS